MDKQQIFEHVTSILGETFGIAPERVRPDARLGEDLDIDSIDAVDLIVQLKPLLGGNLKPEAFRSVRTIQNVVDALHTMMHGGVETHAGG
ncbi:acyl carrier protein [Arenimonas fontis]|uniref:Acyl carrier protein n=1 Tax=Arenimonas fontis TaxID=2608255 RepID=A0A5B2ZDD0_9GAMM|nr:acyl carrier protein [Arenimonas fontis]KAA2285945.1 acyl carrier protein [Arenimonas fontis]